MTVGVEDEGIQHAHAAESIARTDALKIIQQLWQRNGAREDTAGRGKTNFFAGKQFALADQFAVVTVQIIINIGGQSSFATCAAKYSENGSISNSGLPVLYR